MQWSDDRLVNEILRQQGNGKNYARDIFERLYDRRLFKCILDVDQNDFPDPNVRNFVFGDSKDFYKPLETTVADHLKCDRNHVIAYTISFDSAARTESEIPVVHRTKTTTFHKESTLFKSVDLKIRERRFHIYAPMVYQDEKHKKKSARELKSVILEMIANLANQQIMLPLGGSEGI